MGPKQPEAIRRIAKGVEGDGLSGDDFGEHVPLGPPGTGE